MRDHTLTIGITTSDRPDCITDCLRAIDRNVAVEHELVVVDNSPDQNSTVPYQEYNVNRISVSEPEGPGASRQRILDTVDTDYLLLMDDDTFPHSGTVRRMYNLLLSSDSNLVSGVWDSRQTFDWQEYIGSVYQWATDDGQRVLMDVSVSGQPLRERGYTTIQLDEGLPTVLLDTEILDEVSFDSRYDWLYEWIDFYLQCYFAGEAVTVHLDAEFVHYEYPYSGSSIRFDAAPEKDRERLLDKWNIRLTRDAALTELSYTYWQTLPMKIVSLYNSQGMRGLFNAFSTSTKNILKPYFE